MVLEVILSSVSKSVEDQITYEQQYPAKMEFFLFTSANKSDGED
jgi:hypothetical protein